MGLLPDKSSNYSLIWNPTLGLVLDEQSFRRLALQKQMSFQQMSEAISRRVALRSWRAYPHLKEELKRLHRARLADVQKGNENGRRMPSVTLSKAQLERRVALGIPIERIAKEMGTTPFLVERNIQVHGLQKLGNAPVRTRTLTEFQLKQMEAACPGLTADFTTYSTDKEKFFRKAYQAYTVLLQQAWFLKDMCQMPFTRLKEDKGGMEEISWSMNRHELALSQELISLKIPHFREYVYSGNKRADFGLMGTNILIEVDGEYHTDAQNKVNTKAAEQLGYQVMRFTTRQVQFKMSAVMTEIQDALKQSFSGVPLVSKRCGTLKLKATTAT